MAIILLAEDDPAQRGFLETALARAGHRVVACADAAEARTHLSTGTRFDLLITDIIMPGEDGLSLANYTRALLGDVKVIYITGFSAMAPGKASVMSKPFHMRDLLSEVEALFPPRADKNRDHVNTN